MDTGTVYRDGNQASYVRAVSNYPVLLTGGVSNSQEWLETGNGLFRSCIALGTWTSRAASLAAWQEPLLFIGPTIDQSTYARFSAFDVQ